MVNPVNSGLSFDAALNAEAAQSQKAAEQAPAQVPQAAFTVELSSAAQARLLKSEGQTIPEIALKLRLSEDRVNDFIKQLV